MTRTAHRSIVKASLLFAILVGFFVITYPAFAATLFGPVDENVGMEVEYNSGPIDASGFENLYLSFDYIAEKLDTGDSFTYGFRNGEEVVLGTFDGLPDGQTAVPGDETGTVSIDLPSIAVVSDLEIFVMVTASHGISSDNVEISNLTVTGDVPEPADEDGDGVIEGDYCPGTTVDEAGSEITKPNRWRYDGSILIQGLTKNGNASEVMFSMEETKGCGCDQIIDILHSYTGFGYNGHRKFGCSEDLLSDFLGFLTTE